MALDPSPAGAPGSGSLSDVPLPEVLRGLAGDRRTGILHLTGSYSSIVCFREGGVYLAHAETGPSLRQVFLAAGVVTAPRWDQAVETARQGGSLVTALLRVAGAEPDRLRLALYEHTVSTLFELLVPSSNRFAFKDGETHQLGAEFPFAVDDVLSAASGRLAEFRAIAQDIPSTEVVVRVVPRLPEGVASLSISAVEWQVLAAIDGRSSVAEITAAVGHSAFTVFSALHRLLRAGAIERTDR
ncbi:MAG TPA: DUF4388 domain-containing protein [Acidimicrobiales bacterium]|nr:DUF4388 domain-containing protein [Acidimicrobiales bacterium]